MVIELHVVQFWSEIILVISNRTRAACSFHFQGDFEWSFSEGEVGVVGVDVTNQN